MKRALITGITGQDGFYLTEFLLAQGYQVHGIYRPVARQQVKPLEKLACKNLILHPGDMTDGAVITRLIMTITPHEIYNLAAQSHVAVSFQMPFYTAQVNALGILHILEAVRMAGLQACTKIYQASSSELFGNAQEIPQKETTPMYPRSPYAVAKLYGYWITKNYREAYALFACNGILFNHESPLRGEQFVTKKIIQAVADFVRGKDTPLRLGNLDARRDWGYAPDYVQAMWLMLQHTYADDYVIATGTSYRVRDFVEAAYHYVGVSLDWRGTALEEQAIDRSTGKLLVTVDPQYFRPTEVDYLLGDATKARNVLGWQPTIHFHDLVARMMDDELARNSTSYYGMIQKKHEI